MQSNELWKELNRDKNLPELFKSIPSKIPEMISLILACALSLMPIISLIISTFDGNYAYKYLYMQTAFNSIAYTSIVFSSFILLWGKFTFTKVYKSKLERLRDNGLIIFLGLMLFWTLISTVFSSNINLAIYGYMFQGEGLFTVLGYAGFFLIAINIKLRTHIKLVLNIFVTSGSIIAGICLINNEQLMSFVNMDSSMGYFSNQNHYGYFICMAVMSSILLAITDVKPCTKKTFMIFILHVLELGLLLNALINSRSLGPLLAVITALVALLILTIFVDKPKLKRVFFIVLFAIFIIFLSSLFTWNLLSDLHIFSSSLVDIFEDNEQYDSDGFGSGRGEVWSHTVELITQKPLFGHGLDNLTFPNQDGMFRFGRPHCEILQFAACQGIPAAIFYILGLGSLLAMFIHYFRKTDIFTLCMYCIIGAYLISSIVGNPKFYTSPYFYMLLGLCYSNIKTLSES